MATVAKLKKDLDQAKRDVSTGRGSDEEVLKIQKSLDDSNEDLAELKKRKADTKKKIDSLQKESVTYIGESVSSKFRQLMTERLK
jgi:outer membrane protein TolC